MKGEIDYSQVVELDLAGVTPRSPAPSARKTASRSVSEGNSRSSSREVRRRECFSKKPEDLKKCVKTRRLEIGAGDVMIAAITSCTNTSNPGVLLGAGLLAKKAVERGRRQAAREDLARGRVPGRDRSI